MGLQSRPGANVTQFWTGLETHPTKYSQARSENSKRLTIIRGRQRKLLKGVEGGEHVGQRDALPLLDFVPQDGQLVGLEGFGQIVGQFGQVGERLHELDWR